MLRLADAVAGAAALVLAETFFSAGGVGHWEPEAGGWRLEARGGGPAH